MRGTLIIGPAWRLAAFPMAGPATTTQDAAANVRAMRPRRGPGAKASRTSCENFSNVTRVLIGTSGGLQSLWLCGPFCAAATTIAGDDFIIIVINPVLAVLSNHFLCIRYANVSGEYGSSAPRAEMADPVPRTRNLTL